MGGIVESLEVLLAPLCVSVPPRCSASLPGFVARRLSSTILDPPPLSETIFGSFLLYPGKSPEVVGPSSPLPPSSAQTSSTAMDPSSSPWPCADVSDSPSTSVATTSSALGKRKVCDTHDTFSDKQADVNIDELNTKANRALESVITSTFDELNRMKLQLRAFTMYDQLGTSRSVSGADLLEFAVTALGFHLRRSIADDIVSQKVRRDDLFGRSKIFWEGDLRDINYINCWWWMVKASKKTLAQFWKDEGYVGPALSSDWFVVNSKGGSEIEATRLKEYLQRAEMEFSKDVGLNVKEVQISIGLFLCGPKLQRNKDVHLFGLWKLVKGSRAATKMKTHQSNGQQHAFKLSKVEELSLQPQICDFSIEDLIARRMVLEDVLHNLNDLSPYYVQHAPAVKAIGSFLLKEMGKACGRTVWNIISRSSRPSAGDNFDIAGTYLKWDANCGPSNGLYHVRLCNKQQDSALLVAIDEAGHWWKLVENVWSELEDALNEVLKESF